MNRGLVVMLLGSAVSRSQTTWAGERAVQPATTSTTTRRGFSPVNSAPADAGISAAEAEVAAYREQYWRSRFTAAYSRLKNAEDGAVSTAELQDAGQTRITVRWSEGGVPRREVVSIDDRLDFYRQLLATRQRELADLEREADQAGVPTQWRAPPSK